MSEARDAIFQSIRGALGVSGHEAPRRRIVEDRLDHAPKGVIPQRGQGEAAQRRETFKAEALRAQATLSEIASFDALPGEVAAYLRQHNLANKVRCGADERITRLDWREAELLPQASVDPADTTSLSVAFSAIAETGTLALVAGRDNPTHLNFLPDHHIIVVPASEIVSDYERFLRKLRTVYGKGLMPRVVNYITGPSRSADIAHTLLLGAHGPRRLHIIIVG